MRAIIAFAAVLVVLAVSPAQARHRHHHHHSGVVVAVIGPTGCVFDNSGHQVCGGAVETHQRSNAGDRRHIESASYGDEHVVSHPSGCPHSAFCGCGASVRVFGHPVRNLYLAANWFKFRSASPAPGMVAVRNHHVFVIEQVNGDGTVVAYDANSGGHLTRIHTVSLRGMRVVDPHSG